MALLSGTSLDHNGCTKECAGNAPEICGEFQGGRFTALQHVMLDECLVS